MAHTCHALRCETACRPTLLMCPRHWAMVPPIVKRAVLSTYQRGQCRGDPRPSEKWFEAADAAIGAVALAEGWPATKLARMYLRGLLALTPELIPAPDRETLAAFVAAGIRHDP